MQTQDFDWLARIYEEHGPTLHRLVALLGAEEQSGRIVRSALLALRRRGYRLVDPVERIEFLQEYVVHSARAARPPGKQLQFPEVAEARQTEILAALSSMEPKAAEIIVVSHYLSAFGPELAGIMRMSSRRTTQRFEAALGQLRHLAGESTRALDPVDSFQQEVTAALRSAARAHQAPGTVTLADELTELGSPRFRQVPVKIVVIGCLLAVLLGFGGAAISSLATNSAQPLPPAAGSTAPSDSMSLPALVQQVPLYFAGRQDQLLYREKRDLPAGGDLVRVALENLITLVPLDPDYESLWTQGHVNNVELDTTVLTIDLTANAYETLGEAEAARLAINQMVYTAADITGIANLSVYFLADGQAPPELFAAEQGYQRDGLNPMPPLWLTEPSNNAQFSSGDLTFTGMVKPDEEVPTVTVTETGSGMVVSSNSAQTSTGQNTEGWRFWTVSLLLESGSYEILVQVTDPASGKTYSENKFFSVSE